MGWEGIGDLIGTVAKWWTPEKVKARARAKLKTLRRQRYELLRKKSTPKNVARLATVREHIGRLQDYLENN